MHFTMIFFFESAEAMLGTLKYVSMHFAMNFFRASGEAILGTLKYCTLSKDFIQALYQGISKAV